MSKINYYGYFMALSFEVVCYTPITNPNTPYEGSSKLHVRGCPFCRDRHDIAPKEGRASITSTCTPTIPSRLIALTLQHL